MSTIFAILKKERDAFGNVTNVKRYDIAHRYGIGGGRVGIKWLGINVLDAIKILNGYTDKTLIKVHAMDNAAQGVENIYDLIMLMEQGTLEMKYRKPAPKKKPAVKINYNKSIDGIKAKIEGVKK